MESRMRGNVPVRFGEEKRLCASYSIQASWRVWIFGGGCVQPIHLVLANVSCDGYGVLLSNAGRGVGKISPFRNYQQGQRCAIYKSGMGWICAIALAKASMDGHGCWADNIYIEWFWRTVKYEPIFLQRFQTLAEAKQSIGAFIMIIRAMPPSKFGL